MKKFLAAVLAAALIFSLGGTSFAAEKKKMYTFPTFPESTLIFNIPEKMAIETPQTKGMWLASGFVHMYDQHLIVGVEQKDRSRESTVYLMTAHNKKPIILKIRDKTGNGANWREIDMPKNLDFTKKMEEFTGIEDWKIWDCFKSMAFSLDDALLRAKAGDFHIINGKLERGNPGARFPRGMRIMNLFAMSIPGEIDPNDRIDDIYEAAAKSISDSLRGTSEGDPAYFSKKKSGNFEAESFQNGYLGVEFGFRVHKESFYEFLALIQEESVDNLKKREAELLAKTKNRKRWIMETGEKMETKIIGTWNDMEPVKE